MKWGVYLVILLLSSVAVSAYFDASPVKIKDDYFYEFDQKVIEDREITNDEGSCVYIKGSEWVALRGNYLHDCQPLNDKVLPPEKMGYVLYVEDVDQLVIERNVFESSKYGIYLKNVNQVTFRMNNISAIEEGPAITIEGSTKVKIDGSSIREVKDGVLFLQTSDSSVERNKIIVAETAVDVIGTTEEDKYARVSNIVVSDNSIMYSGEGIRFEGVNASEIIRNSITGDKATSDGINLFFGVDNIEIADNTISKAGDCGIMIKQSPENFISANSLSKNNRGICLDGKDYAEGYYLLGNTGNKIHRNIFIGNKDSVVVLGRGNDEVEVFYNSFDTSEEEVTKADLAWKDNSFVELPKTDEQNTTEPKIEVKPVVEEEPEQAVAEVIKQEPPESPILTYALLTLLFVIIVIAVVIAVIKKAPKKR
ncbi:MAG: nitrous oxide reductase family maturation protein NosD [Candidatus Nanoarchaeia archaeon]